MRAHGTRQRVLLERPMTRTRKLVLFGLAALAAVVALVAVGLGLLLDTGAHKARLQATASQVLGLEVDIAGSLALDFFPGLTVTLNDVRVRSRKADVVLAKQARITVGLMSLLRQEPRIGRIELSQATIVIARDGSGRFNFENPQAEDQSLPARDWPSVTVTDAVITYVDDRFGSRVEARDCRVDVQGLRHAGGPRTTLASGLSFTAELACAQVRKDRFSAADLKFTADAKGGLIDLKPFTASVFGTSGSGQVRVDFSKAVPAYRLVYSMPQFPVEAFFESMAMKPMASGRMDFAADLSTQGKSPKELQQGLAGTLSLRAKGLVFNGGDLDREFRRFESSQTFDLVDIGAVFFAGPVGLLVTKGYDFARLGRGAPGESEIRTLVSDWKVERGVARAQDVALATKENRLALRGGLDLVNERFDDLSIALIDVKGCAKVRQQMRGSFQAPAVDKPSVLAALTGPALRLLKKGSDALRGEPCEVFYAGSVAAS
jgi:uncharacterized protein involved in outer membrane biogenesis